MPPLPPRPQRAQKPKGTGGYDIPFDVAATSELLGYDGEGRRVYSGTDDPARNAELVKGWAAEVEGFRPPTNLAEREELAARVLDHAIELAERATPTVVVDAFGAPLSQGDQVTRLDDEEGIKSIFTVREMISNMLVIQAQGDSAVPFVEEPSRVQRLG